MDALMIRSRIKEENVADAQDAIAKFVQALEQTQPAAVRYASCLLSDGVTFVALVALEDDGSHPLRDFPAYAQMIDSLKQWQDGPPAVDRMTVTGSYGLF